MEMKLAIIGTGNVGLALGTALTRAGLRLTYGLSEPASVRPEITALGPQVQTTSTGEAIRTADIVILAIPYTALSEIAGSVSDWQNKIVVDVTNPLAPGLNGLTLGTHTSGAEVFAQQVAGARVVKAFNTTGAANMENSSYPNGVPWMPVCGDDPDAKQAVMELASKIGFEAVDFGPLTAARLLEPLAMCWIHLAVKQGAGPRFALGLLKRP